MVVRERREQADDEQRGGEGHDPRAEAPLALGTRQVLGVDLVARQEEQEGKAQVGQQVHRVREVDDLGQVRPQKRAGDEQEHRFGHQLVGHEPGGEGADRCHEGDHGERDEVDGHGGAFRCFCASMLVNGVILHLLPGFPAGAEAVPRLLHERPSLWRRALKAWVRSGDARRLAAVSSMDAPRMFFLVWLEKRTDVCYISKGNGKGIGKRKGKGETETS